MGQEITSSPSQLRRISPELGYLAPHYVSEEVRRRLRLNRVRQRVSRGEVSYLEVEHRSVVAGVGVSRFELLVGSQRHRGKPLHFGRVLPTSRLHDAVEQPVEPLLRRHGTDVGRTACGTRVSG